MIEDTTINAADEGIRPGIQKLYILVLQERVNELGASEMKKILNLPELFNNLLRHGTQTPTLSTQLGWAQ